MKHDLKELDIWDDYHGSSFLACRRCGETGTTCCDDFDKQECPSEQMDLFSLDEIPVVVLEY